MVEHVEQTQIVIAEPDTMALPALPESPAADRNPALVYLASLSPSSRPTQRRALQAVADIVIPNSDFLSFPWPALRYQHTQAIRSKLAELYSAATARRYLAALRATLKECWRLGLMSAEEYQRAVDVKAIPGERASQAERGRHLQPGELRALLATCCDRRPADARDAAMIAIAYTAGLRRAELSALTLADYDPDNLTLIIRHGKGNKERVVPLAVGAVDALADWLYVRGLDAGPLLRAINRGGRISRRGLTTAAIYEVLTKRAKAAGVKRFSPHDLRRTFAGDLLDAGADIVTVQKLMGHANVITTAGYDRRDGKAKRAAVNKLHLPFTRQWEG